MGDKKFIFNWNMVKIVKNFQQIIVCTEAYNWVKFEFYQFQILFQLSWQNPNFRPSLATQALADPTQFASLKDLELCAAARRATLADLQTVILNVWSMVSVLRTRLASVKSVWTPAKAPVESTPSAQLSITRPSVLALLVIQEIHLKHAQRFQVGACKLIFSLLCFLSEDCQF